MIVSTRRGFTLIELLVVIAIITLIAGVIFASLSRARMKARDTQRIVQAGQIGKAIETYAIETGSYAIPATGISGNEGTGYIAKSSSDDAAYLGNSIAAGLKAKGLLSEGNLLDPIFGKDNYYLAQCTGSSTYVIYLKVEQPELQTASSSLTEMCGGAAAIGMGFNYAMSGSAGNLAEGGGGFGGGGGSGGGGGGTSAIAGGWTDWGTCECGTNAQSRTCTNPAPSGGGADCVGTSTQACVPTGCGMTWNGTGWTIPPSTPSGETVGTKTSYVVNSAPTGIASDGTNMWVATYGAASAAKVAPNGTVLATYTGMPSASAVAFDGTNIWIGRGQGTNGNGLNRITPEGVVTTYKDDVNLNGIGGIAFDGTNLWVTNGGYSKVVKVSLSGAILGSYAVGGGPMGIVFDGTNMWSANMTGGSISKITAAGAVTTYPLTGATWPMDIAFNGTDLWVAARQSSNVFRVSTEGTILGTYAITGAGPQGIAFDGTNMWTANFNNSSVSRITPTGAVTSYSTGSGLNPEDIAYDGKNMWVANNTGNTITKVVAR